MSWENLVVFLAFFTLLAAAIFGYLSTVATQRRLHSNKKKSTLAADAPRTLPPGEKPVDT
jgi:hypothetical protein